MQDCVVLTEPLSPIWLQPSCFCILPSMQVLHVPIAQGEPWGHVYADPRSLKQRLAKTRERLGALGTLFQHLHILGRKGKYNATTKTVDVSEERCLLEYTRRGKGRANTTSTADLIVSTAQEYLAQLGEVRDLFLDPETDPAVLNDFPVSKFDWTSSLMSAFEEFMSGGDYFDQRMNIRFKTKKICPTDVSTPYLMFEMLMVHVVIAVASIERSRGRSFMELTPENQVACVGDLSFAGEAVGRGLAFLDKWFNLEYMTDLSIVRIRGKDHVLYVEYWHFLDAVRKNIFHVYELRVISKPEWKPPIQPSSVLTATAARCGLMTRAQMGRFEAAKQARDALYAFRYGVRSSSVERQIRGTGHKMFVKTHGFVAYLRIACASTVYMYLSSVITRLYGQTRGAPLEQATYDQTRKKLAALADVIGAYIGDKALLADFNKSYVAFQHDQPYTLFGWVSDKGKNAFAALMSGLGSGKSYEGRADLADAYVNAFRLVENDTQTYKLTTLVKPLPILAQRWSSPLTGKAGSVAGPSASVLYIREAAQRAQEEMAFISDLPDAPQDIPVGKGKEVDEYSSYESEEGEAEASRGLVAVEAS